MITATTDAPAWLRRSDQAVSWARAMLQRDRAVVIDCETTDLPGAVCEVAVVDTCGRILLNSLVNPRQTIPPGPPRWKPHAPAKRASSFSVDDRDRRQRDQERSRTGDDQEGEEFCQRRCDRANGHDAGTLTGQA